MSIIDELPGFVLGAVVPGFLQSEAARRNELAQKLSPTLQPPAQPAQQQPEQQQPAEPARAFDQGQPVMQAPQGTTDSGQPTTGLQFAPYPTIDQQASQPSAAGGQRSVVGGQSSSGQPSAVSGQQSGGLLDQISRIMSSPLGLGGMGALGAMMLTPHWAGMGGALGNALMGGMQGYERGSALENQRSQTQAQAEYHRQQAQYQQQHAALEQQKLQEETRMNQYRQQIWDTLTPDEKKSVALGQQHNPNEWSVLERAYPGDYKKQLEIFGQIKKTDARPTAMASYMQQLEGEGLQFGTAEYNKRLTELQAEAQGAKPSEKRAEKRETREEAKVETDKTKEYGRDLDRYKREDKEFALALVDEQNPQRAPQLLAKKKAELAKRHGLTVDPETGAAFGAAEKQTAQRLPSGTISEKTVSEKFGL